MCYLFRAESLLWSKFFIAIPWPFSNLGSDTRQEMRGIIAVGLTVG